MEELNNQAENGEKQITDFSQKPLQNNHNKIVITIIAVILILLCIGCFIWILFRNNQVTQYSNTEPSVDYNNKENTSLVEDKKKSTPDWLEKLNYNNIKQLKCDLGMDDNYVYLLNTNLNESLHVDGPGGPYYIYNEETINRGYTVNDIIEDIDIKSFEIVDLFYQYCYIKDKDSVYYIDMDSYASPEYKKIENADPKTFSTLAIYDKDDFDAFDVKNKYKKGRISGSSTPHLFELLKAENSTSSDECIVQKSDNNSIINWQHCHENSKPISVSRLGVDENDIEIIDPGKTLSKPDKDDTNKEKSDKLKKYYYSLGGCTSYSIWKNSELSLPTESCFQLIQFGEGFYKKNSYQIHINKFSDKKTVLRIIDNSFYNSKEKTFDQKAYCTKFDQRYFDMNNNYTTTCGLTYDNIVISVRGKSENNIESEVKTLLNQIYLKIINYDSDNDGLSDSKEKEYGTNPKSIDTDNDGFTDYEEIQNGYDPLT